MLVQLCCNLLRHHQLRLNRFPSIRDYYQQYHKIQPKFHFSDTFLMMAVSSSESCTGTLPKDKVLSASSQILAIFTKIPPPDQYLSSCSNGTKCGLQAQADSMRRMLLSVDHPSTSALHRTLLQFCCTVFTASSYKCCCHKLLTLPSILFSLSNFPSCAALFNWWHTAFIVPRLEYSANFTFMQCRLPFSL